MKKLSKAADRAGFVLGFRQLIASHIVDCSGERSGAFAVYGLAETRDCDAVEYIDITVNPRRRLLQHWMAPRLWLSRRAADRITSAPSRPLCHWIRELYEQQQRLPVMVIYEWLPNLSQAEAAAFVHRNAPTRALRVAGTPRRPGVIEIDVAGRGPEILS